MKILSLGACFARNVAIRVNRYFNGDRDGSPRDFHIGSVRFNRIDRFMDTYITKRTPELPREYIEQIGLEWPEQLPEDRKTPISYICNQLADYHLGFGFETRDGRPPLLETLANQTVDIALHDTFFDIRQKVLIPVDPQYSDRKIFFNTNQTSEDWKRYFVRDKNYASMECLFQSYRDLTTFIHNKNPNAKVFVLQFPQLNHAKPACRERVIEINRWGQDKLPNTYFIPAVPIPSHLRHEDGVHFVLHQGRYVYDDYTWLVCRLVEENWTVDRWRSYLNRTDDILEEAYRDRMARQIERFKPYQDRNNYD